MTACYSDHPDCCIICMTEVQDKEILMTLDPNNDVYTGDLATLNMRKHAWAKAEASTAKFRVAQWVVLAVGFACIIFFMFRTMDENTALGQLPLHLSIWITAIAAMLVARQGKRTSQQPFAGFHMARFEVDDDTVYYVYQQGMSLRTYYIKDKNIKKIYRDDEAGVLLIEGNATLNIQSRKNETEQKTEKFYALVPFDKYDLDDLLQPYRKKVVNADGKLRGRYSEEFLN